MNKLYLILIYFIFCCFFSLDTQAQLSITSTATDFTIDFDNTVDGVNNGQWAAPMVLVMDTPNTGELDSDGWLLDPNNDPTDFKGQDDGAVGSGGWYAFDLGGGNYSLGVQPTSGFNDHSMTLMVMNNSGQSVTALNIAFKLYANSPQGRNATISYSGASGTNNSGSETTDNILTTGTTTASTWLYIDHSLNITGLSIPSGGTYTFTWSSDRGTGSGSADEWALDDIVVSAPIPSCNVTNITTTNSSACMDAGTPNNGSDDTFTTDVVVTFVEAPTTGNLVLTDELDNVIASVDVMTITSPHTFMALSFPADGNAISITATFDTDMTCTLTNAMAHPGLENCLPATVPWKETFDTAGEGIAGACIDPTDANMCDANTPASNGQWSIILGDGADLTVLNAADDYFRTENGTLVARDLANSNPFTSCELCFLSEVIDISSAPVDFAVTLSEVGLEPISDYANVSLIIDGNETSIPNWNMKGNNNHTLSGDWDTETVESCGINGSNLQIKICVLNSAGAEEIIIDNVCVVEGTCKISDITVDNIGSCNNGAIATDPSNDFYTANVTVTFSTPVLTGTLDLSGDIIGTTPSVDASTLVGLTSYTFVGVQLTADGTAIDLTAAFSDEATCTYSEANVDSGMDPCCAVESVVVDNTSICDDNNTTDITTDDTFTTEVTVTFYNAPASGDLVLSGDVFATVDVTTITSPYTFNLTLPANGNDFNVTANFSADMMCMGTTVITGVASCSNNTPTLNGGLLVNELADNLVTSFAGFGNPEYIELLVIGEAANPTLNVNVSGWIVDDNNSIGSEFGTIGEHPGFLRIKSGCLTDVPAGSLILIYNADEKPANLPADDEDDTNPMDNIYIIPSISTCLEVATDEVVSEASYTTNTFGPTDQFSWLSLNFIDNGDVVQTRRPDGSFYHGFGYGNIAGPYPLFPNGNMSFNAGNSNNISYFCGNSTIIGEYPSSTAFTPGAANNSNNDIIIQALLNGTANYDELIGTSIPSGDCAALAVELLSFTADLKKEEVLLKWLTANEKDNDRFEIEHSNNAIDFKKIGTVRSKGDANTTQDYQFIHDNPIEGNNYYRLRQIDVNGASEYSTVQTVLYKKSEQAITLYPNPVDEVLNIDFTSAFTTAKEISLLNTNGQILKTVNLTTEHTVFELSMKNLPSGVYWIKVVMDEEMLTRKIIKQ